MTMTIDLHQLVVKPGNSVLLTGISWKKYESILLELGNSSQFKFFYDQGTLLIMVPLPEHEYFKIAIGDLIGDLADELDIAYESFGSTTWRRQSQMVGAEPDQCFYIQNVSAILGKLEIDLNREPAPDLVLEIDITSKSLNSLPIYARLGVPEVWRYDRGQLILYQLLGEAYSETSISLALPNFPVKSIPDFIKHNLGTDRRMLRRRFREWIRRS